MRRNAITSAVQEENDEINLTPMLDVVFIMLIFFIVTANFIKEPGLEINRPDSDTAETQENAAILIAVGPTGEVWMDGRRIDVHINPSAIHPYFSSRTNSNQNSSIFLSFSCIRIWSINFKSRLFYEISSHNEEYKHDENHIKHRS